jgi:hypothetical protein
MLKYHLQIKKEERHLRIWWISLSNIYSYGTQWQEIIMISSSVLKPLPSFSHAGSMKRASVISDPFFLRNQLHHSYTQRPPNSSNAKWYDIKWYLHLLKEFQYSLCSFICHNDWWWFLHEFYIKRASYNGHRQRGLQHVEITSGQNTLSSIFFIILVNSIFRKFITGYSTWPIWEGTKIGGLATVRKKFDGSWTGKPKDQS